MQKSKELFTGPFARQMLDPKNRSESQLKYEKWKVFALLKQRKQGLVLNKNSEVLYQVCGYRITSPHINCTSRYINLDFGRIQDI